MRRLFIAAAGAVLCLGPASAQAQLAASHFNSSTEGWLTGDLYGPGSAAYASWNAGGFISAGDNWGNTSYVAPAQFLGDKSAAYGSNLTYSYASYYPNTYSEAPFVVISDGTLRLQWFGNVGTPGVWSNVVVPFTVGAGWEVDVLQDYIHQTPATAAQIQQVLGNLQYLHIQADFALGTDYTELDDVVMEGNVAPEPASFVLFGTGLLLVAAAARRRKVS